MFVNDNIKKKDSASTSYRVDTYLVVKLTCRLILSACCLVDSVDRVLDKYLYGLVRTS